MYKKRAGTSGICGQLYETKLISMIMYRAKHNDDIEDIHLASNVDEIGEFDDICFRAKLKSHDRPIAVFIQAKHRENNKALMLSNKNDLTKYFNSYLKIRNAFKLNNENVLFDGEFEETECVFVLYTTASGDQNKSLPEVKFANDLNNLIGTEDSSGFRPSYDNEAVEFLCKVATKEELTSLAITLAKFICDKADFQILLNDELVLRYHVILAQKIFDVSEIQPKGHRIATFREDFFTSEEEFIKSFKETLFTEVLKERKLSLSLVCMSLQHCFEEFPHIGVLSHLIGTIVTYNKKLNQLEFINKTMPERLKRQLSNVDICQFTVDNAINLAGKKMLSELSFNVPAAFGNKDLTIRGNDEKIEKRLIYLASQIEKLLQTSDSNNKVIIDETLGKGFLDINGGIGSAVGNLIVLDQDSRLMKFTDNCDLLGTLGNRLFSKLKVKNQNLNKYRFEVNVKKIPKLLFENSEYDKSLAKEFMDKLILYTNQADENRVEQIIKTEIEKHQCNNTSNFRIKSDAIFLTYHDEIQKWWMSKKGIFLTKDSLKFDTTVNKIVEQPLLRVMNVIFRNKLSQKIIDCTFTDEALAVLKCNVPFLNTLIVTHTFELTISKVLQGIKSKDNFLLDLEYLSNLHNNDCNELCAELINTDKDKILIFICENVHNSRNIPKTFNKIANAIINQKKIIITNHNCVDTIKKYFTQPFDLVNDSNNLTNMSVESRKNILSNSLVIFQDELINLNLIIDNKSSSIIEENVLNSIINKQTVVVGKSLVDSKYEEIKHLYVERRVRRGGKPKYDAHPKTDNKIKVRTLNDIQNDIVFITAKPGMGKSTLLSHISIETKKLNPRIWIIRINLLEYSREFNNWKENKSKIDLLESLTFLCKVVVSENQTKTKKLTLELEEINGIVSLKHCSGDQWTVFELNMFLQFYNRREIIFVFDGFDEICTHYTVEVMEFLKSMKNSLRKHKMWIASRSYNKIKIILQREFGMPYEILNFEDRERSQYVYRFWKSNLILNDLSKEQLRNIYDFMKFMRGMFNSDGIFEPVIKLQNLLLQDIYINVYYYLKFELNNTDIPLWTFETKFDDDTIRQSGGQPRYNGDIKDYFYMDQFSGTPLHLFLLVDYFKNEIKDISNKSNKWNLDINTLTIYERFLETKLKKIRFQEKNKMDIYNPDILFTYEKERIEFITKHKQVAAYAIFHRRNKALFSRKELKDIKNMIKLIKRGEEKTGLIYRVTSNNLPIFVHMSFAEYFAVEYVCDLLKKEKCKEKQKKLMDIIFNDMFFEVSANVRNILDSKIKFDTAVFSVLQKNKRVIFDLLMEQTKGYPAYGITDETHEFYCLKYDSSLCLALSDNLNNFVAFFISILKTYLINDTVDNFIHIIKETNMFNIAIRVNCEEFITFSLDIVRGIDVSKFMKLFNDRNFSFFVNLTSNSNEEILELLRDIAILTTEEFTPYCMYDPDTNSYYYVLRPY